jgi:hypothetical protein
MKPLKTQAERDYCQKFRHYVHAKNAVIKAEERIMAERGIELPYVGPMKRRVTAHDKRLAELQVQVAKWMQEATA